MKTLTLRFKAIEQQPIGSKDGDKEPLKTIYPIWLRFVSMVMLPLQILNCSMGWVIGAEVVVEVKQGNKKAVKGGEGVHGRRASKAVVKVNRVSVSTDKPSDEQVGRMGVLLGLEQMVAIGDGQGGQQEQNEALSEAIRRSVASGQVEELSQYLKQNKGSRWEAAVGLSVGRSYRQMGYLSRTLESLEQGWGSVEPSWKQGQLSEAQVKICQGLWQELTQLYSSLGRVEKLQEMLKAVEGKNQQWGFSETVGQIQRTMAKMQQEPGQSYKCGPYALYKIEQSRGKSHQEAYSDKIQQEASPKEGIGLERVCELAQQLGMNYQMAYREVGSEIITPAVVHWKVGHYGAVVAKEQGKQGTSKWEGYRLQDPTFGENRLVSLDVLEQEGSGYWLVPGGELPKGWRSVKADEVKQIRGKGQNCDDVDTGAWGDEDKKVGGECAPSGGGMPWYTFDEMLVSLWMEDRPLTYQPARGPKVPFRLIYSQQSGQWQWSFTQGRLFAQAVTPPPLGNGQAMIVFPTIWTVKMDTPGGGNRKAVTESVAGWSLLRNKMVGDQIGVGPAQYNQVPGYITNTVTPMVMMRQHRDGSKELYGLKKGLVYQGANGLSGNEEYYLTHLIDAQGNELSIHYSIQVAQITDILGNSYDYISFARPESIVDASGYESLIHYNGGATSTQISSVEDPFGRAAVMGYDAEGRVDSLSDQINLQTTFSYETNTGFISERTTPYGKTTFAYGKGYNSQAIQQSGYNQQVKQMGRWITATDAKGLTERLEYIDKPVGINDQSFSASMPQAFGLITTWAHLADNNTYYWSKKVHKEAPGDYEKAQVTHWLAQSDPPQYRVTGIPSFTKAPLEGVILYNYPYQLDPFTIMGISNAVPSVIARQVLDTNGNVVVQKHQYKHSYPYGLPVEIQDPVGRKTGFEYATNGLDLIAIKQTNSQSVKGYDLLASYKYNTQHLVTQKVDSSGLIWNYSYNPAGQLLSQTDPSNQTTSYDYNNEGYLMAVHYPGNKSLIYTRNSNGLIDSITDWENYKVQFQYDDFDRLVKTSYPDGTSSQWIYDKLELIKTIDTMGRATHYYHDNLRQLVGVKDALGRMSQNQWCECCGTLKKHIDAQGNATQYSWDIQGRLVSKTLPDGANYQLEYEPLTGRLSAMIDPLGQKGQFSYHLDNSLKTISYTNSQIPTTGVSYEYDNYGRVSKLIDGQGTHTYTYQAYETPGGGKLSAQDGPLTDDTITTYYDNLGRLSSNNIAGAISSLQYDNLGRIHQLTNPLGVTSNNYQGNNYRLDHIQWPNQLITSLQYDNNQGHKRLLQTRLDPTGNQLPGTPALYQNNYQYNGLDQITSWQVKGSAQAQGQNWQYDYDAGMRLNQAQLYPLQNSGPQPIATYSYHHDKNNNLITQQRGSQLISGQYNTANQLLTQQGGGSIPFSGLLNKPAQVKIAGQSAITKADQTFNGKADNITTGQSNLVEIILKDASHPAATNHYLTPAYSGMDKTDYQYDQAGNLLSQSNAGQQTTYQWDGINRLVKIQNQDLQNAQNNHSTELIYNGQDKLVQITEKDAGGNVTSQRQLLWSGNRIARTLETANGQTITKRYYSAGFSQQTNNGPIENYYTQKDHLGSIRQIRDQNGQLVGAYDYDPYGNLIANQCSIQSDFGYAGYYHHQPSGLYLTKYRAYDPQSARWLKRDPIGELGGQNLYAYVGNPANFNDPLGLSATTAEGFFAGLTIGEMIGWGAVSAGLAPAVLIGVLVVNAVVAADMGASNVRPENMDMIAEEMGERQWNQSHASSMDEDVGSYAKSKTVQPDPNKYDPPSSEDCEKMAKELEKAYKERMPGWYPRGSGPSFRLPNGQINPEAWKALREFLQYESRLKNKMNKYNGQCI